MSDAEFTDNMFFQEFEANLALIENGEDVEVVDVPVVAALVPAALQPDASRRAILLSSKKTSATGTLPAAVSAVAGPTPGLEAGLSVGKR
ncbi:MULTISPECIES: hypothetical protein [Enterobacter]|uniref:hypothetical protein n=1 Tax=Enterobacter TaxID=547 RepID=UPI001CD7A46D|nr:MULTISPECIES: hypothetical protein [Enterobacter]